MKSEGRLKISKLKISGTGGQCLMIPCNREMSKVSLVLYNLGGVIFNLFFAGVFAILFVFLSDVPFLSQVLLLGLIFSLFLALSNGIPMSIGGISNDGANTLEVARSRKAREAFCTQLLIGAEVARGVALRDMPEEWFDFPEEEDMYNSLSATLAVFACNRLLDEGRFSEALDLMKNCVYSDNAILGLHKNLLLVDMIFCELKTNPEHADIRPIYNADLKRFMKDMKNYPSVIRTEYAIALAWDKNTETAEKIWQRFDERTKRYPYKNEALGEKELMGRMRNLYLEHVVGEEK